jgi:hypothetical protein
MSIVASIGAEATLGIGLLPSENENANGLDDDVVDDVVGVEVAGASPDGRLPFFDLTMVRYLKSVVSKRLRLSKSMNKAKQRWQSYLPTVSGCVACFMASNLFSASAMGVSIMVPSLLFRA